MSRLSRPYCSDIGSYESPERGYDGNLKHILCFSRGLLDSRHISASTKYQHRPRAPVVQAPSILDQSKARPAGEFEVSDVPDYRALHRIS
jgi:hypothetical protein